MNIPDAIRRETNQVEPKWAPSNWQSYCVRLPDELDQRHVMQAMLDLGVATRRGVMCAHREPAYPVARGHVVMRPTTARQDHPNLEGQACMEEHVAELTPMQARSLPQTGDRETALRPYRAFVPVIVVAVLAIYALPFLATWRHVGATQLPMRFGPDLYLYLNISNLKPASSGMVMNPWYAIAVSKNSIAYLRFGVVIGAFHHFSQLVGGGAFALFLWMLIFICLICICAVWLFRKLLPETEPAMLAAALTLFSLVDLSGITSLTHIHSLAALSQTFISLPYMRAFFPQSAIAPLLVYTGLHFEALRNRTWRPWILMAVMQLLGLLVYPYATLLMALTTGVLLAVALLPDKVRMPWLYVLPFGIVCAVIDAGYVLITGAVPIGGNTGPLLTLDLKLLTILLFSKSVLTTLGCTLLVLVFTPGNRKAAKWTVVSLGIGYVVLYLADSFVSPVFQISHHAGYLTHTVLAVEVIFLTAALYYEWVERARWLRFAAALATLIISAVGAVTGYSKYRFFLAENTASVEGARIISALHLGPRDLVIARSQLTDDPGTWVPLMSSSQVLFCKNSELLLQDGDMGIHNSRKALYLFFTGHDSTWAERLLAQRPVTDELWLNLSPIKQRPFLAGAERDHVLNNIRQEIVPLLEKVQNGDPAVRGLLRGYERIVVLDRSDEPAFPRERLMKYLSIRNQEHKGRYDVLWVEPAQLELSSISRKTRQNSLQGNP